MFHYKLFLILFYVGLSNAFIPEFKDTSFSLEDTVIARNVTPLCLENTQYWLSEINRGVPWALAMLDSYTKLPSGVLSGSTNHLGNFDQCLDISIHDEIAQFTGQYGRALANINIQNQVISTPVMYYAFCVPSTCTSEEMPTLLTEYIGPALGLRIRIIQLSSLGCYIKDNVGINGPLPTGTIVFITLASSLAGLVLICALVEWRLRDQAPALVRACSLTSTCRSLFNIRKHPADISCLHGIRVGSMLWIILGHRYGQERFIPKSNAGIYKEYFADPLKMTVANAMMGVDTFFFLSGFLICSSFLREIKRQPSFDVIKFYIYRYLRIAVPIAVMILFYITVLPWIGYGPLWNNKMYYENRNCKANWWTNLAFVNNVISAEGFWGCLPQTWYTAVDMQLAWLSPLVLLPLYHSPRAGLQLMTLLILISCFIPFAVTYIYKFPMNSLQVTIDLPTEGVPEGNMTLQIYMAVQARATPYLCGILFASFLTKTKGKSFYISKSLIYLGWVCNTAVALTVIYSLSIPHQPDYVYDDVGSAFYAGFHRLAWSAVLIWIIFTCNNNNAGVVDKILSWPLLLPVSRLTYSAYLIHLAVMLYETGIIRTVSYYSDYEAFHDFFGDLVPIFIYAFLLYILVEGPLLSTLKLMFAKGQVTTKLKHQEKIEK